MDSFNSLKQMKILIFICFSLFSINSFAFLGQTECVYSSVTGTTSCNDVLNSTALDTPPIPNPMWDNLMHASCPAGFQISVNTATGAVTCVVDPNYEDPNSPTEVKIADSTVENPKPSENDLPCDPYASVNGSSSDCASETTAKKANELAAEANSKLGSIANSGATEASLLGKILDAIKGLGSGSSGSGGSGSGSGGSGSGTTPPDDSGSVPLTNDVKTIDFSSSMGAAGSCPSDIPFNILGSSYSISYQPVCDFADSIRGVVIALGAFSALLIVSTAL